MKTMKVLATGLMLWLAASVNVASAQGYEVNMNDSIYGLEVTVVDDYVLDFSFYSTYNLNELMGMTVDFYNGDTQIFRSIYDYIKEDSVFDNSTISMGEVNIENTGNNTYKIIVRNYNIPERFEVNRLKLFVMGRYSSSTPGEIGIRSSTSSWWQSNALTFFFLRH